MHGQLRGRLRGGIQVRGVSGEVVCGILASKTAVREKTVIVGREELLRRITVDPEIMVGKPIIRGTRITVEAVLDELAGGVSEEEVLEDFPELTAEDVRAAILAPLCCSPESSADS